MKNWPSATEALIPARPVKDTVQRVAVESMLVNVRAVVSDPANLLNEIDAMLRSFGRSAGMLAVFAPSNFRYSR